jgi:hypothetical protein
MPCEKLDGSPSQRPSRTARAFPDAIANRMLSAAVHAEEPAVAEELAGRQLLVDDDDRG